MRLKRRVARRVAGAKRPLQIRIRGPVGVPFAEWERIGALAGLARERQLDVEVEWLLDDAAGRSPRPRPRAGTATFFNASNS